MDHALGVVERVPMHGQARMAGCAEGRENVAERGVERDRDDVRARHHDVGDAQFVQAEHVGQERAFFLREVAALRRFGDRLLDVVARRGVGQAEQAAQPLEKAGAA